MKKYLLIALLGLTVIILNTKCKKDTPAKTDEETGIITGKWNYQGGLVTVYHPNNAPVTTTYRYTNAENIVFNADGTGNDYNTTFKYTVKDKALTISYDAYTSGGVNYGAQVVNATINQLTTSKLTLHIDETYKDAYGDQTGDDIIEYLVK